MFRLPNIDHRFEEIPLAAFPLLKIVFHLFLFSPFSHFSCFLSNHVVPFLPLVSLPAIVSMGCREHEDCRVVLVVVVGG